MDFDNKMTGFLFMFHSTGFKIALVQLAVSASKADNLLRAAKLVKEAADKGAKVVTLPECFNSPYGLSKEFCPFLRLQERRALIECEYAVTTRVLFGVR